MSSLFRRALRITARQPLHLRRCGYLLLALSVVLTATLADRFWLLVSPFAVALAATGGLLLVQADEVAQRRAERAAKTAELERSLALEDDPS